LLVNKKFRKYLAFLILIKVAENRLKNFYSTLFKNIQNKTQQICWVLIYVKKISY